MKADVRNLAIIVLLSALVSGCSSIRARTEMLDDRWTAYPGVQLDVNEMAEIFGGERQQSGWINGLVTSILVFDLPVSAVFDTLVLPYDFYRIETPGGSDATHGPSKGPLSPKAREDGGKPESDLP